MHFPTYAEGTEYLEKLRYPDVYRHWSNYRDGCLVQVAYRPQHCDACQACYEGWLDEAKRRGKICPKCGGWVVKAGMKIEAEYDDGSKDVTGFCEACAEAMFEKLIEGGQRK